MGNQKPHLRLHYRFAKRYGGALWWVCWEDKATKMRATTQHYRNSGDAIAAAGLYFI